MIVIVSGIIKCCLLEILQIFKNRLRDATIGLGLFNVISNLRLLCHLLFIFIENKNLLDILFQFF